MNDNMLKAATNRVNRLMALLESTMPPDEKRIALEAEHAVLVAATVADGDALVAKIEAAIAEAATVAPVAVAEPKPNTTPPLSLFATQEPHSASTDDIAADVAAAIATAPATTPRSRPSGRRSSAPAVPVAPDDYVVDPLLVDGAEF